jgi:hypothetical protein
MCSAGKMLAPSLALEGSPKAHIAAIKVAKA